MPSHYSSSQLLKNIQEPEYSADILDSN